jgi:MoxR-like ATPase
MAYDKLFSPPDTFTAPTAGRAAPQQGDQRQGRVYVYDKPIVLAVNVALATGRPLLIYGPSGSGKSSLARNIAHFKKWRFVERVITSRTQARDLLYDVDLLKRLHDAQAAAFTKKTFARSMKPYIVPGPLWWAFDRRTASTFAAEPAWEHQHDRAVVLLDEIDKADPDVPNNLLVPLGSLGFEVEPLGVTVEVAPSRTPLVILTSNEERQLPPAFLRRCVELRIAVSRPRLVAIAYAHFPKRRAWVDKVGALVLPADPAAPLPSPAEFVDWLRACDELGEADWSSIKDIVISSGRPGGDTR